MNRNMIFAHLVQKTKKKTKKRKRSCSASLLLAGAGWCCLFGRPLKRPKDFILTSRAEPSTTGSNGINEASRKCVLSTLWLLYMSILNVSSVLRKLVPDSCRECRRMIQRNEVLKRFLRCSTYVVGDRCALTVQSRYN